MHETVYRHSPYCLRLNTNIRIASQFFLVQNFAFDHLENRVQLESGLAQFAPKFSYEIDCALEATTEQILAKKWKGVFSIFKYKGLQLWEDFLSLTKFA